MSQYLCPTCEKPSKVTDTRPSYTRLRRRRICDNGHKFSTFEVPKSSVEEICELFQWVLNELPSLGAEDVLDFAKSDIKRILLGSKDKEDP